MTENFEKIILHIDSDLEDIVPGYLEGRHRDVVLMSKMLGQQDFESLLALAHRIKGSGASYGFDTITNIGHDIETAAKNKEQKVVEASISALASYLKRIEVNYE